MSIASSLYALSEAIDPRIAYWSVLLVDGREWSERKLVVDKTSGVRKLDWGLDLVSTGDIYKVKELTLHCPDGRIATLEMTEPGELRSRYPAFQFKTRAMNMVGAGDSGLEYQVIGRVTDKESGRCECFIWDYRPLPGKEHLIAYTSSIYTFGAWRDNITPLTALGIDVQGFRL